MSNPRQRTVVLAVVVIVAIWVFAVAGYGFVQSLKVTADKVRAYAGSVDLNRLSAADRARALKKLADELNALSLAERQQLQMSRVTENWFAEMTEAEKEAFIAATMPTGIKQMLAAFEQQPEEKRRKAIDDALKQLRDQSGNASNQGGGSSRLPISPELEARMRTVGLESFYSQSSAQTKAELAPLLEEMQRTMESGRMMRRPQQ
jgi:type II secretory pathway component HofQ